MGLQDADRPVLVKKAHTQENVKKVLRIENKRKQISFHNFPIHYQTSGLTMRVMPFTQKSPVSV